MTFGELLDLFEQKSTQYHRVTLEAGVEKHNHPPLSNEWFEAFLNQVSEEILEPNVIDTETEEILKLLVEELKLPSLESLALLSPDCVLPSSIEARAEKLRQFNITPLSSN